MKNKYIQTKFGQCGYVALANAFNIDGIIPVDANVLSKGLNWIEFRLLVEKLTNFSVFCVYFSKKNMNYYIPVFEVDEDLNQNKDLYAIFFVTIYLEDSKTHHCILVIKENFNDTLTVLDPYKTESDKIHLRDFFHLYDVIGIESICHAEHGGTMFFDDNGAHFSDDGLHRFVLWRIWDRSKPMVMFIGLNPSTADATNDDPTIKRVKRFASDWGYGGVYMLNLFSFITPYPAELIICEDNTDNDFYLKLYGNKSSEIVYAWGSFKEARERALEVQKLFINPKALHINNDGSPKHPLYVKADTKLVNYG